YGICFTKHTEIVLISTAGVEWNLPGGTIEEGENAQQALVREVLEEACARVTEHEYLGCQKIEDLADPQGPRTIYQTRFWSRVEIDEFRPSFERKFRRLVSPEEFLSTLGWGTSPIAKVLLDKSLEIESGLLTR
ncbi:MAG: NUDIX hydrolase, partial [Acidimicrobiia bacterium]